MNKNEFYKNANEAVSALYSYSFLHEANEEDLRRIFLSNAAMKDDGQLVEDADPLASPAGVLASGVLENQKELDAELKPYLRGWKLERLGVLELLLLRLGLFALKYQLGGEKVVLSGTRKIASEYGLEQAAKFLAGIFSAWIRANHNESQ